LPEKQRTKLAVVVGATASGKTEAAILIAQAFDGEVINSDSRLFYRGMDIGTAKPSPEQLSVVPHHLISFLEPQEPFSLADFLKKAHEAIAAVSARGRLPVIAGGTGQYVWGLLEGWEVPQVSRDTALRAELEAQLEQQGVQALFERLKSLDPDAAAATDPRNHRRIIRAIERAAAGAAGQWRAARDLVYDTLIIGLKVDRAELHRRIAARVDGMIAAGWAEETRRLLERGVDLATPAMSAIGYREMAAHIRGELSLDEVRERTIRATNRLVRHQNNWFKPGDGRITWVDVTDGKLERVLEPMGEWLQGG
jgi:tRNA dimethylallyltransferase